MEEGSLLLHEILSQERQNRPLENTLLVDIFLLRRHDNDDDDEESRIETLLTLARLCTRVNDFVQQQAYPWMQGGEGPVFGIHVSDENDQGVHSKKMIPHLRAQCRYGVSVNDAWALVHMVWQWTMSNSTVAVECWDQDDGQVLLIEAAQELPAWVDDIGPDACRHVCWIQGGRIILVAPPQKSSQDNTPLTLTQALHALQSQSMACQHFLSIDQANEKRMADSSAANLRSHRAAVALPVPVAHLLHKRPELLPLAISTWANLVQNRHHHHHQPLSEEANSVNGLVQKDWQWTVQSFPRISYAQSRTLTAQHGDWATPQSIPVRFIQSSPSLKRIQKQAQNHATPHLKHGVALGVRLVAGLEVLLAQQSPSPSPPPPKQHYPSPPSPMFASDTEERILHYWVRLDSSTLSKSRSRASGGDWLREAWSAGPNQAVHSLEDVLQCPVYYPEVHNQLYPLAFPMKSARQVIEGAVQSCPQDPLGDSSGATTPSREKVDLDESWLTISDQEFFSSLEHSQQPTVERDTEEMEQVLDGFRTFMAGESQIEGVAHPSSSSKKNEPKPNVVPVSDTAKTPPPTTTREASMLIRPAAFMHLLRETLAAPTVEALEKYVRQPTQTRDLYFSQEDYNLLNPDSDESDEDSHGEVMDHEMDALMKQMDEELKHAASGASRTVDSVDGEAFEDEELAEDAHLLSNLVESVSASAGGPGPVRNILQEMGRRLPSAANDT